MILQPGANRDVRRAAVHRGVRPAERQACCPEPASRSAQVLLSVRVSASEREWLPAQASRGGPSALRAEEPRALALLWAQAWAAPRGLQEAAAEVSESDVPREEAEAAARAVELRRAAARVAWAPDVLRAEPEAAVSGRAAAGPRPEAAKAASERQAAVAGAAEPEVPQAEAEAEAAPRGAAARRPAEAQRAGAAAQRRAAERPGARAQQAAQPLAVPSAAASVFRQGPSLEAGPARPRAAKRLAHAMRCLPIASRSEPWWQAARNEDWS
uniref:Uncharacterized protein n=1 Tax=Bradyrhizobium diazoefficiens TaxID=1355477 RepID=A0A810B3I9_9BRAD|nr:hypothetical protein XF8B_05940 [Bradyrhizobium diazoefficiens]